MKRSTGLSLQSTLAASPQQAGKVQKLHMSSFFTILPKFLQRWIHQLWFLSFLRPSWKPRYLVLLGSFLYKFPDDERHDQQPKGSPIPIDEADVHLVGVHEDSAVSFCKDMLTAGSTVICVSTLRKRNYYACSTREEALTWLNSLREAKQEVVTRSMGHASQDSYPQSWTYFDSLGRSLLNSKDRIHQRIAQSNLRELELSNFSDGGPAPRGFYG